MEAKKLIDLIELKDKGACALMDYYIVKGLTQGLQDYTDAVCETWAKRFIEQYQEAFNDRQTQLDVFRYISSIGANKPHSGKRFSEALYKQLHLFVEAQEQVNILK